MPQLVAKPFPASRIIPNAEGQTAVKIKLNRVINARSLAIFT